MLSEVLSLLLCFLSPTHPPFLSLPPSLSLLGFHHALAALLLGFCLWVLLNSAGVWAQIYSQGLRGIVPAVLGIGDFSDCRGREWVRLGVREGRDIFLSACFVVVQGLDGVSSLDLSPGGILAPRILPPSMVSRKKCTALLAWRGVFQAMDPVCRM